MKDTHITWILGTVAVGLRLACTVLNVVFAYDLSGVKLLSALRILLFIAFGVSLAGIATVVFFTTAFVQKLHHRTISFNHKSAWRRLVICATIVVGSLALPAVTLVWLAVRQNELPKRPVQRPSKAVLVVWFVLWGLDVAVEAVLFVYVGLWTQRVLKAQSVGRLDLDFGIRVPPTEEVRTTRYSYNSQDPTLHSPPRTPVTRAGSSIRHSSSTRVGPGSSRTKLVNKGSARSSEDFPARETTSMDSAFDNWDTSSVHREMRSVVHSSPNVALGGLETIPGSRSVSPADALEGPFLPDSPHATSSELAQPANWGSSSPRQLTSSPPSSPPNFSRPTSRSQNQPLLTGSSSMTDLIHPLFRPNSPRPPPIAVAGTMVTASPLAGQPITPRTLARVRANTLPHHWRPMPSPTTSSTGGPPSIPNSPCPGSPGLSAKGEEELPPILPGFILSAGQRSSFVGYGRRKSTRERPRSADSHGNRLSFVAA